MSILSLVIERTVALVGEELEAQEMDLCIEEGRFAASSNASAVIDGRGTIAMPAFVNSHVHLSDAPLKGSGVGLDLDHLIHPVSGIKNRVAGIPPVVRKAAMETYLQEMVECGVAIACNFHEGGVDALSLVRSCRLSEMLVTLVRPQRYFNEGEIRSGTALSSEDMEVLHGLLSASNGIGLSGANEHSDASLSSLSQIRALKGIHAAERRETREKSLAMTGKSEIERVVEYLHPDFIVHLVAADAHDLQMMKDAGISAVLCPRSNGITGCGFPPVRELMSMGIQTALGTDNAMLNSPDMFREMEYLSRYARSIYGPSCLDNREIIRMATVNGARVLGIRDAGAIAVGMRASLVLLDAKSPALNGSKDMLSAIVHRAGAKDVLCTIKEGSMVYSSRAMEARICSQV